MRWQKAGGHDVFPRKLELCLVTKGSHGIVLKSRDRLGGDWRQRDQLGDGCNEPVWRGQGAELGHLLLR